MDKYIKKTFDHAWQAVKFFEDGGELFAVGGGGPVMIGSAQDVLRYIHRLYTIQSSDWREQLNGTVENGVLCWAWDCRLRHIRLIVDYREGDDSPFSDTYTTEWAHAEPLTRAEILKLAERATE